MRTATCHPEKKHYARGLCAACYIKERRKDPEKKLRYLEANKRWLKKHPNYEKERSLIRRQINPEPLRAAEKKYRKSHPENRKQNKLRWQKRNPEKYLLSMRAAVKRRKALKRGATISIFSKQDWRIMKEAADNKCFYCGGTFEKLTQDHKLPLSRGGNHTKENIVPACVSCNCRKGSKTTEEYLGALDTIAQHPNL